MPLNVELQGINTTSVRMSWDPPTPTSKAVVKGYIIKWSKSAEEQDVIVLGNVNEYKFTELKPGESISASVCAYSHGNVSTDEQLIGPCSELKRAGWFSLAFL